MAYKLFQIICIALILTATSGYRILGLFPFPARSHFNVNSAIMKSLANAGHEVVVITPFNDQPIPKNYRIIDCSENMTFLLNMDVKYLLDNTIYEMTNLLINFDKMLCDRLMNHEEIRTWFENAEKMFDVIFFEMLGFYECYQPLAEKWNIPIIGTITTRSWSIPEKAIGNPRFPSVIQEDIGGPWRLNNMYGRFRNAVNHFWRDFLINYITKQKGVEFYNENIDMLSTLLQYRNMKPSLVFFNSHFTFFSRAMNPNAIEIGGIHVGKAKPLPETIQKFIDDAEYGVILFTLGSATKASSLPQETQLAFKEAFRKIPQRVIWKYENPMDDVPENVMLLPWLPQRDILAHENVKAVISHCGLGGTYEIITTGKPTIATPLFIDQLYNAVLLEEKGVAIKLDIHSINTEIVLDSINRIVNDTSYVTNMRKLSRYFGDRPINPQQSVVYWTEYVIRYNGAPHLTTEGSDLNWFQYLLLDILFCVLFVFGILLYAVKWSVNNIRRNCENYQNVSAKKKFSQR